ncbi:MAG: hypothetical protein AB8F94_22085 [Saprospiraceae bacterium]
MMSQELKNKIIKIYQKWDSFKNWQISIKVAISTNKDNFDRHFTSFSKLEFVMKDFGVRFSGNRARFEGEKQSYEIGGDHIIRIEEKEEDEFEIIEKYSEKVFRRTMIKFLD